MRVGGRVRVTVAVRGRGRGRAGAVAPVRSRRGHGLGLYCEGGARRAARHGGCGGPALGAEGVCYDDVELEVALVEDDAAECGLLLAVPG